MSHLSQATIRKRLEAIRDESAALFRTTRNGLAGQVVNRTVGDSVESVDHEVNSTVTALEISVAQQRHRAACIALTRLAAGTYGVCLDCRKAIPWKRLAANLLAGRCRPCQEEAEQHGNPNMHSVHHSLFPEA